MPEQGSLDQRRKMSRSPGSVRLAVMEIQTISSRELSELDAAAAARDLELSARGAALPRHRRAGVRDVGTAADERERAGPGHRGRTAGGPRRGHLARVGLAP